VLGERPNQLEVLREDVVPDAAALLNVSATPGEVTLDGLRNNVSVGIQYLAAWLNGSGAVAIFNLMEDAATSEISRAQVWQWLRDGRFSPEQVRQVTDEELAKLLAAPDADAAGYQAARELFDQVATGDEFVEFLTLPAYELLG
jgi:malate synthase